MIKSSVLHRIDSGQSSTFDSSASSQGAFEKKGQTHPENEETHQEYQYGGYHPIKIHDKLGTCKNYEIVRKLGWGHFSTVWLAFDTIRQRYFALKIVKSSDSYTQAALDEIRLLERVSLKDPTHPGHKYLVNMYEWFYHQGPNGQHVVMVFEVLGENLLSLVSTFHNEKSYRELHLDQFGKTFGGLPINTVKKITKQVCLGMDYLHRVCGLIHTDIKPENILIEIKDVEKFISMLDLSHQLDANENDSHTPIKSSNPLPSPIIRSDSYFNTSSSSPVLRTKSSQFKNKSVSSSDESVRSSISYRQSENYTTDPLNSSSSMSPTLNQVVRHPSSLHHCCTVTTSEAASDDEDDEDETPGSTIYYSDFELPKSFHFKEDLNAQQLEELESLINIKIADLGNACYYDYHFTSNIQTRQYRAPEIIVGCKSWGASADCWSLACVVFELLTGDFLFNPVASETYGKDDDHLAQIIELLNPSQEELSRLLKGRCKYRDHFFRVNEVRDGEFTIELRKIKKLKYWCLKDVLVEKYKFEEDDAESLSDFLLHLLKLVPKERSDFGGLSNHPWLNDIGTLSRADLEEIGKVNRGYGSRGEDIKGWYKTYVSEKHRRRHHSNPCE